MLNPIAENEMHRLADSELTILQLQKPRSVSLFNEPRSIMNPRVNPRESIADTLKGNEIIVRGDERTDTLLGVVATVILSPGQQNGYPCYRVYYNPVVPVRGSI